MAKKTHAEANYRRYGDASEHCGNCSMWRDREKDRCTLVEDYGKSGIIQWFGTCDFHELKKPE